MKPYVVLITSNKYEMSFLSIFIFNIKTVQDFQPLNNLVVYNQIQY